MAKWQDGNYRLAVLPSCREIRIEQVGSHGAPGEITTLSQWNLGMKIHEFIWPEDRIDHIARHGVTPDEVEETCFGQPLVQRAKSQGENPVYYVLGQTETGRYLFCIVIRVLQLAL